MKKLFYFGLTGLALFEILNVYFIMPMPGSQRMDSIDLAYFLYIYRWYFRIFFTIMTLSGSIRAFQTEKKWIPAVATVPVLAIIYLFNFRMTADKMFLEPEALTFKGRAENSLSDSTLVVAVSHEGEAKAYPVRFIIYHHQVRDTVGGKPVMVTYCSVCRTGRVFEPLVNGKPENFRLVGMDHFNAMFEDAATKSWWQQSTGKAITGSLKGSALPELMSMQVSANKFFTLFPFGKVMQADEGSWPHYDSLGKFETGKSTSKLTGTDSLSWKEKSWVVGLQIGDHTKAYDWSDLEAQRIIHDEVGNTPVIIALSDDGQSFAAFKRNTKDQWFQIKNDTLITPEDRYGFSGRSAKGEGDLVRIKVYQEFWHSWQTFHPDTDTYSR